MKITYTFANGDTSTVEVNETLGDVILEFDRLEHNNNQTEKRRHASLEAMSYEGDFFAVTDEYIESIFKEPSKTETLKVAISTLKPKQQELLKALFYEGITQKEYAERIGVSNVAVHKQLQTILKKLKKFF